MSTKWCYILAGLMAWVLPCAAQVAIGDELQMQGNGTVSTGYAGSFGDASSSSHSLNVGVNGSVSGSYHDPNFLSFTLLPYYNQAQNNSLSQATSDSSGVNATASIFGGSHFPGSFSYNRAYNSFGTFGLPGVPSFTTRGNSQGLGIGWSELLPDLPTLTANYTVSDGDASVYGTSQKSKSSSRIFGLRSSYSIADFNLSGGYTHSTSDSQIPDFFGGLQPLHLNTDSDTYGGSVSHPLPLHGAFSAYYNRVSYRNAYEGGSNHDTVDNENATALFRPSTKLSLNFSQNYNGNLAGNLEQAILSAGGGVPTILGSGSHSLSFSGGASYLIIRGLGVSGQVLHLDQSYAGQNHQATLFNGTLYGDYGHKLFGLLDWSVSVLDTANEQGNSSVGVLANVGITRKVKNWDLSGTFNYAHNVETLLVGYATSYYRFGATANHRFSTNVRWGVLVNAMQNDQTGGGTSSQNYTTSFSVRWISATGNYSRSSGTSFLTASGLQPITVPPAVLPPNQLVMYGGSSYGFSLAATPTRRLTISAAFANAHSNTVQNVTTSLNRNALWDTTVQYQLRKLGFKGGYSRLSQNISAVGTGPQNLTSYYIGVYRWFNLF
jgi:hypothetical protein